MCTVKKVKFPFDYNKVYSNLLQFVWCKQLHVVLIKTKSHDVPVTNSLSFNWNIFNYGP